MTTTQQQIKRLPKTVTRTSLMTATGILPYGTSPSSRHYNRLKQMIVKYKIYEKLDLTFDQYNKTKLFDSLQSAILIQELNLTAEDF